MMDIVDQTLKLWRQSAFVWGESDCMLSVGDYAASLGAKDVTNMFRGKYDDEAGALAQMRDHGGAGKLIELTGATEVFDPERGDMLVITAPNDPYNGIGGICTGDMVAVRRWRGVAELRLDLVHVESAWRWV